MRLFLLSALLCGYSASAATIIFRGNISGTSGAFFEPLSVGKPVSITVTYTLVTTPQDGWDPTVEGAGTFEESVRIHAEEFGGIDLPDRGYASGSYVGELEGASKYTWWAIRGWDVKPAGLWHSSEVDIVHFAMSKDRGITEFVFDGFDFVFSLNADSKLIIHGVGNVSPPETVAWINPEDLSVIQTPEPGTGLASAAALAALACVRISRTKRGY